MQKDPRSSTKQPSTPSKGKKGVKKPPTPKQLKKTAWALYSKYIRLKYSFDGLCQCYTCGKVDFVGSMQAGHGIGGRGNYVLFLDDVVRPQCYRCNGPLRGNYEIFAPKLIIEIGEAQYYKHVAKSRQECKLPKGFYPDLIADLKARLAGLI